MTNPLLLFVALNGIFGELAQEQARIALDDWSNALTSRVGQASLVAVAVLVVCILVLVLYNRP